MEGTNLNQHSDPVVIEEGHVAIDVTFTVYEECEHTVDTTLIVPELIAYSPAAVEEFLRDEEAWLDDFDPAASVSVNERRISDVQIVLRRGHVQAGADRSDAEHDVGLRRRYVLAGRWPAEHAGAIVDHGWSVANAPRPLSGRLCWTGECLDGIHYAAGPLPEFAARWHADNATLLVPITPAEAVAKLRAVVAVYGYDWNVLAASRPEQFQWWAEDLQLPWEPAWAALDAAAVKAEAEGA
ncbi:hypothetical protein [Nonomuraea sp. NPDC049784]|uniref:hypothetical protein n=1 Tax=Nonomuraea sp. NPDC049784 TaxID=3154361 RepID=UPI0033DC775B